VKLVKQGNTSHKNGHLT